MQQNRFELKYLIDEGRARSIRDFLRGRLVHDEHALKRPDYRYPVYSLYLDSPELTCYREVLCGKKNRFKLRVRFYDNGQYGPTFFEIKRRLNDVILKKRTAVRPQALHRLLSGQWPSYDDLVDPDSGTDYEVLQHFIGLAKTLRAEPKVCVAYSREAYTSPENETLRITFDRNVVCSRHCSIEFPDVADIRDEAHPGVILELKFTDTFPAWLNDMVGCFNLKRRSFAKYVNSVEHLLQGGARLHGAAREALV